MLKHFLEDGCWLSFAANSEIRVNSVCLFSVLVTMQVVVPFSQVGGPFLLPMFLRLTLDQKKGQHMGLSQHRLHFAVPCFLMMRMWQNLRMDVVTPKGVGRLP